MFTFKLATKTVTYIVKNNKVVSARCNKTGRMVKTYIAQEMHNKMLNAARNFMSFVSKNKFQAQIWKEQLKTYAKSFGYKLTCSDLFGKTGLTLNTFTKLFA